MNYIVSVPFDEKLAEFIGKKSSEDGLVFYNRKIDNDVIVAVMPANREDKVYYSIAESMLIAAQIIISTASVDRQLGEAVVAASLLDRRIIITNDSDISKMVGGVIKDFMICGKDEVLSRIVEYGKGREGSTRIDIDKAFPVKGIGTVLLGIVTRGTVKVHDTLYHSSGKQVMIKSIQSQDVDVEEAGYGTRVGLAVKGLEHDEVEKGDLLTVGQCNKANAITASLKLSAFAGERVEAGKRYVFVSNFSRTSCRIDDASSGRAMIAFEKPVPIAAGDEFMLVREESPRIFAAGTVSSVS